MLFLSYLNKVFMKCAPSQNKTITLFVSDSTNSKTLLSKNNALLPRKQFFKGK